MSKMTTLVGPPRDSGMLDSIRASVKAVATSPSASTCSGAILVSLMRPFGHDRSQGNVQLQHRRMVILNVNMQKVSACSGPHTDGLTTTTQGAHPQRDCVPLCQELSAFGRFMVSAPQLLRSEGCERLTLSAVPVGKYGSTRVKEPMNMRGSW